MYVGYWGKKRKIVLGVCQPHCVWLPSGPSLTVDSLPLYYLRPYIGQYSTLWCLLFYGHLSYGSNREHGEQGINVRVCVCMYYIYKHKSKTWMPSLEIWGRWVKDLLWPANSPHTSNVTDSCVKSTAYSIVLQSHRLFGGNLLTQSGVFIEESCDVIGTEFPKGKWVCFSGSGVMWGEGKLLWDLDRHLVVFRQTVMRRPGCLVTISQV